MLTAADAAHLLRRAAFGATPDQVQSFVGLTREEAIDRLFDTSTDPLMPDYSVFDATAAQTVQIREVRNWWMDRMVTATPTVSEKLTLFWHNHFATAFTKVASSELMWDQHVVLRNHGLGSFRTLLEAVSLDAAMLRWLDNDTNVAGAEQENFARELMELFTVGNGRFTEDDVVSMARAWTGHNIVGGERIDGVWRMNRSYAFYPDRHDDGQKTLFGITRNWDALDTLDELCFGVKATATSDYVARKMFQFYVHRRPSQATVDALAATWRNANLDSSVLLRTILLSDEFWAPETRYALVKNPVEYVVDLMRRYGLTTADHNFAIRAERMGMALFEPPNVAGWGANGYWLNNTASWEKASMTNWLKWKADDYGVLQDLANRSADEATDDVEEFLGLYEVSAQSRSFAVGLMSQMKNDYPWRVTSEPIAIGLFIPEVQCA